jgi:hypothetical protein
MKRHPCDAPARVGAVLRDLNDQCARGSTTASKPRGVATDAFERTHASEIDMLLGGAEKRH